MERLAVLLKTDGTTDRIDLGKTDRQALKALYDAIECSAVDMIAIAPNLHMWVDDEALIGSDLLTPAGLIEGEEKTNPVPNRYAGAIAHAVTQSSLAQELYGHVVFTGGADETGNTTGLTSDFAGTIDGWVEKIRPLLEDDKEEGA